MNKLILGGLVFGAKLNFAESLNFLEKAYEFGIRDVDTGSLYGNEHSEEIISTFNKRSNKEFKIHTKIGLIKKIRPDNSFSVDLASLTPEYIENAVKKSLEKCKTDNLEKVSLHAFCKIVPIEEQIGKLREMIKDGYINSYGICNFEKEELLEWLSECNTKNLLFPNSLDVHFNILEQKAIKELFPSLSKYSVKAIPHRILCRGILAGRYKNTLKIPSDSRAFFSLRVKKYLTNENLDVVKKLEEIAINYNLSLLELVISWTLSFNLVKQVCIGTGSLDQLEQIVTALKNNSYKKEINTEIDKVLDKNHACKLPPLFFEK